MLSPRVSTPSPLIWRSVSNAASAVAQSPSSAGRTARTSTFLATIETMPRDKDGQFSDRKAIYAREAVLLDAYPDRVPVRLQAHRIGGLTIAAIPCEVFVEIGLELKRVKPLEQLFTISLANGYNGYLPTPEHHRLGGYETWRARSSYLETEAATAITKNLQEMLAEVAR